MAWASVRECPPTECCRLIDALQEREHAFPEQCRSLFVVVEEAVVSEQVPIARIQEYLRALDCLVELAGGLEVFPDNPLVVLHHVDLQREALRPGVAELRGWESSGKEQGSFGARTSLGQHLRRHHPERESAVDELVRQALSGESTALEDRVEADLLRVADALVERSERLAVIEIRSMDGVSGSAEFVRERKESGCLSLRMVKKQDLGHVGSSLLAPRFRIRGPRALPRLRQCSGMSPELRLAQPVRISLVEGVPDVGLMATARL